MNQLYKIFICIYSFKVEYFYKVYFLALIDRSSYSYYYFDCLSTYYILNYFKLKTNIMLKFISSLLLSIYKKINKIK